MLDALRRLAVPLVLLAAVIGSTVALGRLGNDDLPPVDATASLVPGAQTPVFSLRRVPSLLTSPRANEELVAALTTYVDNLPPNSCMVVNAGGERVFTHNAAAPLVPASNMKILTAIAALEELGPDYRFTTSVQALQEPDAQGVLAGDLYLIGGGDPVLTTDAYRAILPEGYSTVRTSADELADLTVAANIITVEGGVKVDESRYDTSRSVSSWPDRFLTQGQAGSLSAASLDDGFVGLAEGYASQIGVEDPPPLARSDNPAALFAANFDDLLEARSVIIRAASGVVTELPEGLVELTRIESPPLSDIVAQMLVNSDNTTAELLVKELGYQLSAQNTPGGTTSGTLAVGEVLRRLDLGGAGLFIADGSGLSPADNVTCHHIASALDHPEYKDMLRASMPIAAVSGTLADDFGGTQFEGRLRAKTGSLGNVAALSGYFITDPGVEITFALIINTADADAEAIPQERLDGWMRPLPRRLAPYPEGPPIEELGPKGLDSTE